MGCSYRKENVCEISGRPCEHDCQRVVELEAELRPRRALADDKLEECARDEIVRFVVEHGLEKEDVDWLLEWAHRRRTQLLDIAEEGLRLVTDADGDSASTDRERLNDIASVGRATLRRMGVAR
jgi:hypothetical protein